MNQETGSNCGRYFLPLTLINEQTDQEISSHLLTRFGGALATCQALLTFYGSNLGPHITAYDGTVMTDFLPSFPHISTFASKSHTSRQSQGSARDGRTAGLRTPVLGRRGGQVQRS